jgi:hypothetical protein
MSIENQLKRASELAQNQQHQQALELLQDINEKPEQQSCLSLLIQGVCQHSLQQVDEARSSYQEAQAFAVTDEEKLTLYRNLRSLELSLGNKKVATEFLAKELEITGVEAHTEAAILFCDLAYELKDYHAVQFIAEQLLTISDQWIVAALYMVRVHNDLRQPELVFDYLKQLMAMEAKLSEQQTADCLMYLLRNNYDQEAKQFFEQILPRYKFSSWCKKVQAELDRRLQTSEDVDVEIPEARVIGTNQALISLVEELLVALEARGTSIHDRVRIYEQNGELSVKSFTPINSIAHLILVPIKCIPMETDYDYALDDNNHLIANPREVMVNPDARDVMALMVKIYNATDKFNHWQSVYPLLALRDFQDILQYLLNHKQHDSSDPFMQMVANEQWQELTIKSYFNSRTFSFRREWLNEVGLKTDYAYEKGILTVVDFVNHRVGSSNYNYDRDKHYIDVISSPDPDTREIFVQYNLTDLVNAYLFYGFVDEHFQWLNSRAMTLTTDYGFTIKITNNYQPFAGKLPPELDHLRVYLPGNISQKDNEIEISHLVIPRMTDGKVLRNSILYILSETGIAAQIANSDAISRQVDDLILQVLSANNEYWFEFTMLVNGTHLNNKQFAGPAYEDLHKLCKLALAHLKPYENIKLKSMTN